MSASWILIDYCILYYRPTLSGRCRRCWRWCCDEEKSSTACSASFCTASSRGSTRCCRCLVWLKEKNYTWSEGQAESILLPGLWSYITRKTDRKLERTSPNQKKWKIIEKKLLFQSHDLLLSNFTTEDSKSCLLNDGHKNMKEEKHREKIYKKKKREKIRKRLKKNQWHK